MLINCSTCLELITPSDELSAPPCGHVIHTTCILQWFETGKHNCPHCRKTCRQSHLRRIYLNEGADVPESQTDPSALHNALDSFKFRLKCSDMEKNKYKDQLDTTTAKYAGIQEEYKCLKQQLDSVKENLSSKDQQLKILKGERERGRLALRELDDLKEQINYYETIKVALEGTTPQLMDRLHLYRDYSKETKEMCHMVEVLKKHLGEKRLQYNRMHNGLQSKSNECSTLNLKLSETEDRLRASIEALKHAEAERDIMANKLESLQNAIDSPSGDPRQSAIKRLITENPAPLNMSDLNVNDVTETKPLGLKMCSLVGLKRSPCKNVANNLKTQSLFTKKAKSTTDHPTKFYDGMGGHSKKDTFPYPKRVGGIKSLDGLKVKSTKVRNVPTDKKTQLINKYFNFDSP